MTRRFALAATLLLASTTLPLAQEDHDHDHEPEMHHLFALDGLHVLHPWTRATGGKDALVFMELSNEGDTPVSLIGAEADFAAGAELVGYSFAAGSGSYQPVPPVPVQPERELDLAPDGLAIQLTGLTRDLAEGAHLDLTLLTSLGALEIEVAVEAHDARQHSHAGHAH